MCVMVVFTKTVQQIKVKINILIVISRRNKLLKNKQNLLENRVEWMHMCVVL